MNRRFNSADDRAWPPKPGFFRMALIKSGWKVPCEIAVWRGVLVAKIDGRIASEGGPDRVWHSAERITEAEYKRLLALKDQMRREDPTHPCLNPLTPINPNALKPLEPK
jgi:hypothetical protein